jgi:membrane fusion protein (multidrug efflux system)
MTSPTASEHGSAPPARQRLTGTRWAKLVVLGLLVLLCLIWTVLALRHRLTHVSAQDARIMADQITISSRLPGWVSGFTLIEGDELKKGQPVAQLNSLPDQRRFDTLAASVAAMQAQVDYQQQRLDLSEKQLRGGIHIADQVLATSQAAERAAHARRVQAERTFKRSQALLDSGNISKQQRDQDYYRYQAARAEHERARQQVGVDRSATDNARLGFLNGVQMPLPSPALLRGLLQVAQRDLAQARARLEQQKLRLRDLQVRSPARGVVNKTLIQQGEYVSAGQPILMMHDPDDLWVQANIKETDIGELRVGQPVAIQVDAHPDQRFSGRVQVIGRAATSQFALLPNPNPSGNFTKITQRIPVRIALEAGPRRLIGPGMMVEVDIDVSGDRNGD